MKIFIKKPMQIPEIPDEVEFEGVTLRDFIELIFRDSYFRKEIIDPRTGEFSLEGLIQVALNDTPYHNLPGGLDTGLHDGDRLTLSLIQIGGG
jgi:hypothetical protein